MSGRRMLVSGATSGLGLAVARRLAADGHRVWALGSRDETLAPVLREGTMAGGSACDVADEAAVREAVGTAAEALGGLDGAFVNAGIDGEGLPFEQLSGARFRRVLEVNVLGTFHVAQQAVRVMPDGSAIVINASVNALRPEAAFADYNASKAAALSLAQTMALDLAARHIAVTAICPGYFPSRMTEPYLSDPAVAAELLEQIPAGRFGRPEEVGALVAFLLGPDAAFLTGGRVTIDGGRSV